MQINNKILLALMPFLFVAVVLTSNACGGKDNECVTTDMSYKDDILPLLADKGCSDTGCHGTGDGLDYKIYADFKSTVTDNRLLGAIKRQPGFSPMPKNGDKLSDCEISKIEAWVTQGAKDN